MQPAAYELCVDPLRKYIRITMSGFFGEGDVKSFVAARDAAHIRLRCAPNQHVTLVDMRGMQIQPQPIVELFKSVLANPTYRSKLLAVVVATSLARMQIKRATEHRDVKFFTTTEEAEHWLGVREA